MFGFGPTALSEEKKACIAGWLETMTSDVPKKNPEWWKLYCEESCMITPPGGEPIPVAAITDFFAKLKIAFPDWTAAHKLPKEDEDTTEVEVHLQMSVGLMKADLAAWGPFPEVKLANAAEKAKTVALMLPWETSTVVFNASNKIVGWAVGSNVEGASTEGVTTLEYTPNSGFGACFAHMGMPFLAPSKKEALEGFVKDQSTAVSDPNFWKKYCVEDAYVLLHGGQKMPMTMLCNEFMVTLLTAFPSWTTNLKIASVLDTDAVELHLQHELGSMVADLKAFGPFPEIKMADAHERAKTGSYKGIWEGATAKFNKDGKMVCWEIGSPIEGASKEGVTTGDLVPSEGLPSVWAHCGWTCPPLSQAKKDIITQVLNKMWSGEDKWYEGLVTEDCTFRPPGAPEEGMPIDVMAPILKTCKAAYPDWTSNFTIPDGQLDIAPFVTVHTQQVGGVMKADLGPMGPFPPVKLSEASSRAKTEAIKLPFEDGQYFFNQEGTKLCRMYYPDNSVVKGASLEGVTTMNIDPPAGFVCLFKWMGVELPAPGAEAAAAPVAEKPDAVPAVDVGKPALKEIPVKAGSGDEPEALGKKKRSGCCGGSAE